MAWQPEGFSRMSETEAIALICCALPVTLLISMVILEDENVSLRWFWSLWAGLELAVVIVVTLLK